MLLLFYDFCKRNSRSPFQFRKVTQTFAHKTQTSEVQLSIAYVRGWCEEVAGKTIPAPTFSRWCSRFCVSGRSESEAPLPIVAALITCAALHRMGVRSYTGQTYKELYPLVHRKVLELCNVNLN